MPESNRGHNRIQWGVAIHCVLLLGSMALMPGEGWCQSTSQAPTYQVLEATYASLAKLLEEAQLYERPEQVALENLYTQTVTLRRLLALHGGAMSLEFNETLDANAELLRRLSWSHPPEENLELLADVARDIRIKNQYLEAPQMGAFPFERSLLVLVKVRTWRDGDAAPGYSVGFNTLRDKAKPEFRYPVSSATDNAQRLLPPGVYAMRVSRGSESVSKTIEVGEAGQESQTIDVEL